MTSDPARVRARADECFVYIQLPGTLELLTCARFAQHTSRAGATVGRLVYGASYRRRPDAVPLDPIALPVADRVYETAALGGIFGALRDASADGWGRDIIRRQLGRTDLTEIEYLLHAPEDRAGALSFGTGQAPPPPVREYNRVVRLGELFEAARILDEEPGPTLPPRLRHQLDRLLDPGTSLGGARPKNSVEDDQGLWVAKFPRRGDPWSYAPVEAAMLSLARQCDIRTPPTRIEPIADRLVLLVKRFDRERPTDGRDGYFRHRMVSAVTVLGADDGGVDRRRWSYVLLADELRRWSERIDEDRAELFRRMVFNALISNTDDHPRNHALIAPGRAWRLAPAYDLTPAPMPGRHERDLAMVCGRFGRRARRANLLSDAPRFGLVHDAANAEIDRLKGIVRDGWEREIRRQGGTTADCAAVAPAMVDEGFEYPVE